MYISLDRIKDHLIIDRHYHDEDPYLLSLYNVAEEVVRRHIDCPDLTNIEDEKGDLPQPLIHAMLLFIGNMYANRESVTNQTLTNIPNSFEYILSLFQFYYPSKYTTV